MIVDKLVVGPFETNCYIVGVAGVGMIIDPGDEAKRILQRVSDLGLDIKLIALTHGHIDHVGGLKEVSEATGARVAMHSGDTRLLYNRALAIAFSRTTPVVVSSVPAQMLDSIDLYSWWSVLTKSAPSSIVMCGLALMH